MFTKKEETGKTRRAGALASLFAVMAASAAAAGEITCEQDLMPVDGPKTVVTVSEKSPENFRVSIKSIVNGFGNIIERPPFVLDNVACSQTLAVTDHKTGAVRLESLGCGEADYNADGLKKRISVNFSENEGKYFISEVTYTRPPLSPDGGEIGFIPQAKYKTVGVRNAGFSCTLAPAR